MENFLRLIHVLGATVLFGTGIGIAFFMVVAHRTRNPAIIAHVAGTVVIADTIFTATAVILQPLTGMALAQEVGLKLTEGWLLLSIALYVVAGLFWLPVVAIQIRMRNIAERCAAYGRPLSDDYFQLYRIWFACGAPTFLSLIGIVWLMLTKPSISLF